MNSHNLVIMDSHFRKIDYFVVTFFVYLTFYFIQTGCASHHIIFINFAPCNQ